MLNNKGENIEFKDSKGKLTLRMLEERYPKEYLECIEDFNKHWESKGYYNGNKIGVSQLKGNRLKYYQTDYKTMRFIYNFLRHKVDLPNYILNSSLGIHTIIRDDAEYLITRRKHNSEGDIADNLYQLSTSEGIEVEDILNSKERKEDLIQYLIKRSLEEELGIELEIGEYKYIGYSEEDNRPYILYEIKVENLRELLKERKESTDSLEGVEDILEEELVTKENLYDTKNKQLTDSYIMYLNYLNKTETNS